MYQRNLDTRLFITRVLAIAGIVLCIYFSTNGITEYAYLLGAILLFSTVITFTQIQIYAGNLTITRYYFFGFIPVKHNFYKTDLISVHPFEVELDDNARAETDTWFDFVLIFIPRAKAKFKRFIIDYKDEKGDVKRLRTGLSEEEVDLILKGNL